MLLVWMRLEAKLIASGVFQQKKMKNQFFFVEKFTIQKILKFTFFSKLFV